MKIIILTTNTPHHLFFVKNLCSHFDISSTIIETNSITAPFETHHPFESKRDEYELHHLLKDINYTFDEFCQSASVDTVNDENSYRMIDDINPDIIITFGTGKINNNIIDLCKNGFINLHGGCPQYYRGLDTHMWAIYHKQFSQLITTLHILNSRLDDGEIIAQGKIGLDKNSTIIGLRSLNTQICIDLTISAIQHFERYGYFKMTKQKKKGRYYSFMPKVLKEICLKNFNNFVETL